MKLLVFQLYVCQIYLLINCYKNVKQKEKDTWIKIVQAETKRVWLYKMLQTLHAEIVSNGWNNTQKNSPNAILSIVLSQISSWCITKRNMQENAYQCIWTCRIRLLFVRSGLEIRPIYICHFILGIS